MKTKRLRRRMVRHHLPLLGLACVTTILLYVTRPYRDVLSRASFATAYPAVALLCLTLVPGPMRLLTGKRNPVSDDLRRDLGIWAGLLGIAHAVIGQCVHLRGRPWLYYVYGTRTQHRFPLRHDLFGIANHTGAIATLLLLALLATSNDRSLRTLGTRSWKQMQRWNYAILGLAGIHAIAYQVTEKQKLPFALFLGVSLALTVGIQVAGILARKRRDRFAAISLT